MQQSIISPIQMISLPKRPRRNRKSAAIRDLIQETYLHSHHLVAPLFVLEGENKRIPIESMPGIFRYSIDLLVQEVLELYQLGIRGIELFPVIAAEKKDAFGSEALRTNNLNERAVKAIKKACPDICVIVDIALDPFTDHGHDGLVDDEGNVLNDQTLEKLAEMALLAAGAGADIVAPSDMMDGRVAFIRRALDKAGHTDIGILAYAAKYASALYGPFRDALNSAPKFGDKKSYQLNPANKREALLEAKLDEEEGADILLIKPALAYLDIIAQVRENTNLPIAAYHVSGEYSMVMAAAQNGWIDGDRVMMECLLSIKRAGADFILTYAAKQVAKQLKEAAKASETSIFHGFKG